MACPICGASCRCQKAGPGGLCCSCHRHTPRTQTVTRAQVDTWRARHGYAPIPDEQWERQYEGAQAPAAVQAQLPL